MKNLMIYVHPSRTWSDGWGEQPALARLQIDNSLDMGWRREDLRIVTNFPFSYNAVNALVLDGDHYCYVRETASKINVICHMFERGMIEDDLYWFHDWDAYQLEDVSAVKMGSSLRMTDYGITQVGPSLDRRWSTGSMFFGPDCGEIFHWIREAVYKYQANEEVALQAMSRHNKNGILSRIRKLNITYNFATRRRRIMETYKIADKPLRVIHFHPNDDRPQEHGLTNVEIVKALVPERLINLFRRHGLCFQE